MKNRNAEIGDIIRIIDEYYINNGLQNEICKVIGREYHGVFVKGYGYIVLDSGYEILKKAPR